MSQPTWIDHLLVVLLGVVVPVVGVFQQQPAMKRQTFDRAERVATVWNMALSLAIMGAAVCAAWWFREGSFEGLGLGPPERVDGTALGIAVLFLAVWSAHLWLRLASPEQRARTRLRWDRDTPFMPRTPGELPHFAVGALAAGIFEEIVFRGLLISYLAWYTGPELPAVALAVVIPGLVFGFSHLYQGPAVALLIAAMAVVFGALYVYTGSLWIPMGLHAFIDLAAAWIGVRWILREPPPD